MSVGSHAAYAFDDGKVSVNDKLLLTTTPIQAELNQPKLQLNPALSLMGNGFQGTPIHNRWGYELAAVIGGISLIAIPKRKSIKQTDNRMN